MEEKIIVQEEVELTLEQKEEKNKELYKQYLEKYVTELKHNNHKAFLKLKKPYNERFSKNIMSRLK